MKDTCTLHRILIVGTDPAIHPLVQQFAHEVFAADDLAESTQMINMVEPDLIMVKTPCSITQLQQLIQKEIHPIPVICVTPSYDDNQKKALMNIGVLDYLAIDDIPMQFKTIIGRIEKDQTPHTYHHTEFFQDELAAAVGMAGKSKAVFQTIENIKIAAGSNCNPILITGETGTGKELAAKAVHHHRHADHPFVAVNCAALTPTLLESELFGHVKGSFTGADNDKTGLLQLAGKGTLFLDEISEMPIDLQAKLLRILQEKTFRKVGGDNDLRCKATIIASSNRNLLKEVSSGKFRQDLYYRLNIFPIHLAEIRSAHRRSDIPLLARYFLETSDILPPNNKNVTQITKIALEVLQEYDWPGNVRELRNVMERAIMLETTDKIGLNSIVIDPATRHDEFVCAIDKIKDFSLAKAERELVARALRETGWQKTRAAALLGITRATLYAKVKQHNIKQENTSDKDLSAPVSIA